MEESSQIIIELAPADDGESVRVWMSGKLPKLLPRKQLRRGIRLLSEWSCLPVAVVLSVNSPWMAWFDLLTAYLEDMRENQLELHFSSSFPSTDRWSQ